MTARRRPSGHWLDYPDTTYGIVLGADYEQWDQWTYEFKVLFPDTTSALKGWTTAEAYEPSGTITRDANDAPTSFAVVWPDGSAGTFTTTATDTASGAVNAFTITHTNSGKTVTQPAMTRNSNGAVTSKPALTVA